MTGSAAEHAKVEASIRVGHIPCCLTFHVHLKLQARRIAVRQPASPFKNGQALVLVGCGATKADLKSHDVLRIPACTSIWDHHHPPPPSPAALTDCDSNVLQRISDMHQAFERQEERRTTRACLSLCLQIALGACPT